jgi:hypothetical protein
MKNYAENNIPQIIEQAAKSNLGIFALMVIALSILAFLFFRQASQTIRVFIFLLLFAGAACFGFAFLQTARSDVWRIDDTRKPFVFSDPSIKVRIWYDKGDGERVGIDNSNRIDPIVGNFIFLSKGSSSIFTIESGPNLGIFLTGTATYAEGRYEVLK